jgi:DNA repair exonuclease SbcCD nuclease subunit
VINFSGQQEVIKLDHHAVNLVYATDFHLSAIPPGRRADNYQETILGKLKYTGEMAARYKGVVLGGGDVFHYKKPKAMGNTLGLIESTARVFKSYPLNRLFTIIGNHDLVWDLMESLPHQPLGVLIASGVCHNLVSSPIIFTNRDETISVLVEGYPYCDETALLPLILDAPPRPQGVTYRIALLHAYGHPDAENATFGNTGIPYNPIGYPALAETDYDFVCWGHDHSRKETVTVGNVTHIHLGSLARAALNMDEVDRPVSLALLSFSEKGMAYKELPIPVKPLEVIFTTADKGMEKVGNKTGEMSAFFSVMDEAVEGIESSEPREVLWELTPKDDPHLFDKAVEVCEL